MTIGRTRPRTLSSKSTDSSLHDLLSPKKQYDLDETQKLLERLRQATIGDELLASNDDTSTASLRPLIWKLLLGVTEVSANEYLDLVKLGPSSVNDKIRNDSFRTLATDVTFQKRVKEGMLVRLLDAFAWKSLRDTDSLDFTYIQGMNVLAGPFLYTMPSELEAFFCFSTFIRTNCPLYVVPTLDGVHKGVLLLDKCLEILDKPLYAHLQAKGLSAQVYAFPSILTFSACTAPLEEALQIWDFLLAYGVHLNILCIVAQLYLMREDLLASDSPSKMLRTLPALDAKSIKALCCQFIKEIPRDIYDKLARHPWEPTLQIQE